MFFLTGSEVGIELSRRTDETWEVESGKCTTQAVECDFKPTKELADLKLQCVKQDNQNCMYVQKAEAEMPSHGIQILFVEDEPQGDLEQSARVGRAASQSAPGHKVDIKLTNASRARLKRKSWFSFLWFMTALWVQVNVLKCLTVRSLGTLYPDVPMEGIKRFGRRLLIGDELGH